MPRPALKRRKYKLVRTPGGRLVRHYLPKRHDVPKCAVCKRPLHGFWKMTAKEERKGHKPPQRPYGGYLCHKCLMERLKKAARSLYPL